VFLTKTAECQLAANESHYVFDVLYSNTTDIQLTTHSTDTHGANQVNFAILSLFGYQFAPRYKDIRGKTNTLCDDEDVNNTNWDSAGPGKRIIQPWTSANTVFYIGQAW